MINEILAVLPLQEMEDFYNNKLKDDPDFQALIAKLKAPEFAQLVAEVKAMPEYQNMLSLLKSHGIDVEAIQEVIDHFFGWGFRSARAASHLDDLFKEFMSLIPIDKILGIVASHLQNDPEVQEAFAYLKSDEFQKIVMAVDNSDAFMDVMAYVYNAGIDIYSYINMIHDIFGLPHVNPPSLRHLGHSRTLVDMINEILAVLPLQEMEDFYNNKLKDDPDFQALIAKLKAPEFAQLVAEVKAMPEYQNMLSLLKSHGIDVEAIQEVIDHFFGWGFRSARAASHLDDLFKEFMSLIPIDKILGIVASHLQNDPEVQEAFAYLKSDEFQKIVMAVDNSDAFMDVMAYVYNAGIDIYSYINMIHDIFGLPHVNPPSLRHLGHSRTLVDMINEILAVLPLQEMEDFYNNKLKDDPDFQALIAKLKAPEFAQLVAEVKAMPEYQNMLSLLKSHGIDVEAIQEVIDHFFGWGFRSARAASHLDDLFKEFMSLIPIDKILGIVASHLQNDPEVQEAFAYLKSDEFQKIVMAVDNSDAFMDVMAYVYNAGIDIYSYINMIHDIFGLPHVNPPSLRHLGHSRTLVDMINEILAVLPLQEMEDFYNNKLKDDPEFQALIAKLKAPEFAQLVAEVKAMPEYQNMLSLLKSHGIDVEAIQEVIDHFFGWGFRSARATSHLDDLFKEFMSLIPIDKILGIVASHLQNDPEVQEAFAYLKSDEFQKIVMAVDNSDAFMDVMAYVYNAGIDIYSYINMIHDIFGLPHVNPPSLRHLGHSRTLVDMINEILAVLPLQEMEDFYNNKLKDDPDFQALIAKLKAPEFAQLVAEVKAMPEYQNMLSLLKSHGIDVEAIQEVIDHFFGWGFRSARAASHLDDLFKEFMSLIPIDKILGIVASHLQNDPEVQEAFAYLKSDEFQKIVMAVDNSDAFMDVMAYVYNAGIDIYSYINMIHDIFGLPHVNPPSLRHLGHSRTLVDMINEILAVLPLQEMEDFYNNKLKDDPDFQALIAKLKAPEFAQLVAEVKAMPEYQNMLSLLKSHGIDVEAIQEVIDHFFGWGFRSARAASHLDDLFKEFMSLIPIDKILGIVASHLQNDPEVQEAFAYLKSDEFQKIVMAVDNSDAFMDVMAYVYNAGIDIYSYINMIHDIFGLPHVNPPSLRHLGQSRTLVDMINEILAVLPLQEMEDFYNNKLKDDPDFQALIAKLKAPEFAQLVAEVKAMPEYQNMLSLLKSHGIDVEAIQEVIDHFFGWGFRSARAASHLDDLFKEFMSLIPIDKILGIVASHLQNDPEVQEAFAYLKSDEFQKIVMAVDNSDAFMDVMAYVYNAGIDIYSYINMIHDIFGLPHVNPPSLRHLGHSRTLVDMINEILAVLPLQEMEDFYNNKLKDDPDFQALIAKLKAPEFAQLVAEVKAMPEYQNMLSLLKSHGIDVEAIQEVIDHFFGWGFRSARAASHLDDLFKEFMSLIPIDKILGIVASHLQNDPEVQEAFAYLKSDEFQKIVMAVDNSDAFMDVMAYVYNAGIDIYSYINMIHDIFGLPHVNPPSLRHLGHSRTLVDMINEILAVLPLQEMEDFYNNKLKDDPDFQVLIAKLKAPEFAQLVAEVKAMPEYQNMLSLLKSHGIDVEAIQEVIDHFFGWGF
ncbi:uncharacterized protein [Hetaerina americana]|uniref:uncharacterized protein n=1 Tax=Hetaerina americana TaxID=62018 RepID=UPI003A7F4238